MNLFSKKILLIFFYFFVYTHSTGQVNFYTSISPETVNKDDYVTYRIIIENAVGIQNITPPSFKNFTILSGPSQETGMSSVNGHTTRFISLVYVLKPRQNGTVKIPPAMTTIGGRFLSSNSVTLVVKNVLTGHISPPNAFPNFDPFEQQSSRSDFNDYIFHKGDNVTDKVNKNMQLRLETDKTTCYVGEPVVATYKLYTRLKSESKLIQNPSFNGFSVIEMQEPDVTGYANGNLNGKEYNIYIIRKAQLYALQPGIINLESAELENKVQFIKEEYANQIGNAGNLFNDFAGSLFPPDAVINQTVSLVSLPVNITVKPLPETNKPASFNGAVGNFTIEAVLQKPLFSTDEAGRLSVTISGSGNMQLLTAPDIDWPKGIESFDPKLSDNLVKTTIPISGTKNFEYSFAANDSGHYTLPAINFSYFDPGTATYKTVSTTPIVFQVTKGNGRPPAILKQVAENDEPSFINRLSSNRWWIIIIIAALMIAGLTIFIIREKKSNDREVLLTAAEKDDQMLLDAVQASTINQQNVFLETERCLYQDDCFGFYSLLNKELRQYLGNKFSIDANAINSNSIGSIIDKAGIPNDIALRLLRLMQDIEWQMYTPFERNERTSFLYQEAHSVIQMINACDVRHP